MWLVDRVRKDQALRQKAASTIGAAARGHLARKHLPQPEPEPEPEPVRVHSGPANCLSSLPMLICARVCASVLCVCPM